MFKSALLAGIVVAASVSVAAACGYKAKETAQTPIPPVAEAPVSAPAFDQQKDVAEVEIKTPSAKVN